MNFTGTVYPYDLPRKSFVLILLVTGLKILKLFQIREKTSFNKWKVFYQSPNDNPEPSLVYGLVPCITLVHRTRRVVLDLQQVGYIRSNRTRRARQQFTFCAFFFLSSSRSLYSFNVSSIESEVVTQDNVTKERELGSVTGGLSRYTGRLTPFFFEFRPNVYRDVLYGHSGFSPLDVVMSG